MASTAVILRQCSNGNSQSAGAEVSTGASVQAGPKQCSQSPDEQKIREDLELFLTNSDNPLLTCTS